MGYFIYNRSLSLLEVKGINLLDFKWLDDILILPESDDEIFVYLGKDKNPFSVVLKIAYNQFLEPVRLPPTSKDSIVKKHNKGFGNLDRVNISSKSKMIIALLTKDEALFRRVIEQAENGNTLKNETIFKETPLEIDFYNDIITEPTFETWVTTKKLRKSKKNNVIMAIFSNFIAVISRSCRYSRQRALTQLVNSIAQKEELVRALICLLLQTRKEITISIIREVGRQRVQLPEITEFCKLILEESNDTDYIRYAYLYLHGFDIGSIRNHPFYKDLLTQGAIFQSLTSEEQSNIFMNAINKEGLQDAFHTLEGMISLDEHPKELSKLLFLLYPKLKITKHNREKLRKILVHLLKFAELTGKPNLCGFIAALCFMGRKTTLDRANTKSPIDVKISKGNFYFVSKYVIRRITSLITQWLNSSKPELGKAALAFYLNHHPPEGYIDLRGNIKLDKRVRDIWVLNNELLKTFESNIAEFLNSDIELLKEVFVSQAKLRNTIFLYFVNIKAKNNQTNEAILKIAPQDLMFLHITDLPPKIEALVNSILENKKVDIDYVDIFIQEETQEEKIIEFFTHTQSFMPFELFDYFIQKFFDKKFKYIDKLIDYLTKLNHNQNTALSRKYIESIINFLIDRGYEIHYKIEFVDKGEVWGDLVNFVVNFVLEWDKLTFQKFAEENNDKIDAIRIMYENHLKTGKANTWDPISVETLNHIYTYTHGEIITFIDGSVQYAMNKPNWEQAARHYLALGMSKINRESLAKSKIREIPTFLLRDIEGQIALNTETLLFCERNGFNEALENLIIRNIYKRGWNIDRNISRKIPNVLGNISPKLRSYFSAYLLLDQSEVGLDVIKFARDVEDYAIRERVSKSLERYGTPEMWLVMAESKYNDIIEESIKQLNQSRLSPEDREILCQKLFISSNLKVRELARKWILDLNFDKKMVWDAILLDYEDNFPLIFEYLKTISNLNEKQLYKVNWFIQKILFDPGGLNKWIREILLVIQHHKKTLSRYEPLNNELLSMINTSNQSRQGWIVKVYAMLQD